MSYEVDARSMMGSADVRPAREGRLRQIIDRNDTDWEYGVIKQLVPRLLGGHCCPPLL